MVIALIGAEAHHNHGVTAAVTFSQAMLNLSLQSAPALLIGYMLAGLLGVFLTPARAQTLANGSPLGQATRGVLFGLPLPVCSCGVLPIYEGLVKRGVPAFAAMAFLIATPELGLDALLLSVPLLGTELTGARLVAAAAIAVGVAWVIGRMVPPPSPSNQDEAAPTEPTEPLRARLIQGLRFGFIELVDHTAPWIVMGLIVAALAEPLLGHDLLTGLPKLAQVPLFALIGIPLYVCASGATPLAAIAIHKGISPGAALAFLIAGPATNTTTFAILARLHGRRVAAAFGAAVLASAVVCGWLIDVAALGLLHHLPVEAHAEGSALEWVCLIAFAAICVASLLRQGPRGVIGQLTNPIHTH